MSHVQGSSDYMDSSDINPDARLPVELLHQIVSSVVADYLDDIIVRFFLEFAFDITSYRL